MPSGERVLCIAAHPDDEVLGCGGTLAKHKGAGDEVAVLFLADGVGSRGSMAGLKMRQEAARRATGILGIDIAAFLLYKDNQMDAVPLLAVIKDIEYYVSQFSPTVVYTHWEHDLNVDHQIVSRATTTACRPGTRWAPRRLLYFETPSSTEWQTSATFKPQVFVDITAYLVAKLAAYSQYTAEVPDFPHARSMKAVEALATFRGTTANVVAVEAFILGREIR